MISRLPDEGNPSIVRFSAMLSYQHRMHPAIARIVSHAFYKDKLLSSDECIRAFSDPAPVRSSNATRLPELPIVWVDMPWVQSTVGIKRAEHRPGPTNPEEVEAVLATVRMLKPTPLDGKDVSLALLTPYRKQVAALHEALETADTQFRAHLRSFANVGGSYVHTVDSFQGSEAHAVIVSLVRNNDRASLNGALGFLRDQRRMNVLLSRAEWRLIIVGSMEFLRHTVSLHAMNGRSADIDFLRLVLEAIDEAHRTGVAATVPVSRLIAPENL